MLVQALGQTLVRGISGCRTGVYYDIDRGQFVLMRSKGFADQALYAIASDGSANDFRRDGEAQPCRRQGIGSHHECEHRIGVSATLLVRAIEVRFATQPLRGCEAKLVSRQRPRVRTGTSDRESLASLGATAGQNQSSAFGSHARAKTMGALAMNIAWLISALHGNLSWR